MRKVSKRSVSINSEESLYHSKSGSFSSDGAKMQDNDALTFCPNLIFDHFPKKFSSKPGSEMFEGAVVLADISGFSKFAGEMCNSGPKGLDILHQVTSNFLGQFVETIYEYEGDVFAFAGDALICMFAATSGNAIGLEKAVVQAIRCTMELRKLKNVTYGLSAHFAITCGRVHVALLGGVKNEWMYMLNGRCVGELHDCIEAAKSKEIVCSKECLAHARSFFPGGSGASGILGEFFEVIKSTAGVVRTLFSGRSDGDDSTLTKRSAILDKSTSGKQVDPVDVTSNKLNMVFENGSIISSNHPRLRHSAERLNIVVGEAKLYVPRPALNALNVGGVESVSEIRSVTTVFLSLDSYDPELHVDPFSLQPVAILVQELLQELGGFFRQFLVDDKGCVVIAMWGVHSFTHSNDCSRALYFSSSMMSRLKLLNHSCSIGLTVGRVYCGIIGSSIRRDYACIGDKVNISARLMRWAVKAKGRLLVDPEVYENLVEEERKMLVPFQELNLKGVPHPVTPYTLADNVNFTSSRSSLHDNGADRSSVLRRSVADSLLRFVRDISSPGRTEISRVLQAVYEKFGSVILLEVPPEGQLQYPPPSVSAKWRNLSRSTSALTRIDESLESIEPSGTSVPTKIGQKDNVHTSSPGLPIFFLLGPAGSGKSTAIRFLKAAAVEATVEYIELSFLPDDESKRFSAVTKILQELALPMMLKYDQNKSSSSKRGLASPRSIDGSDAISRSISPPRRNSRTGSVRFLRRKSSSVMKMEVEKENTRAVKESFFAPFITAVVASLDGSVDVPTEAFDYVREMLSGLTNNSNASSIKSGDIAFAFAQCARALMSQREVLISIGNGQFCDSSSWEVLQYVQAHLSSRAGLGFLISIQTASSRTAESTSAGTVGEASVLNNIKRTIAYGSVGAEVQAALSNEERDYSAVRSAGYQSNSSSMACAGFLSIRNHISTVSVELGLMTCPEILQVLTEVLGGDVASVTLAEKVLEITAGEAFWVTTAANYFKQNGVDQKSALSLSKLIVCKLELLSMEQLSILKCASVLGEEFTETALEAVAPETAVEAVKSSLRFCSQQALVRNVMEKPLVVYAFSNHLIHDVVYDMVPPSEKSGIHLCAAEYIEENFQADLVLFNASLSYHFSCVEGERAKSFEYAILAAEAALCNEQHWTSIGLYYHAADLCDFSGYDYTRLSSALEEAMNAVRTMKDSSMDSESMQSIDQLLREAEGVARVIGNKREDFNKRLSGNSTIIDSEAIAIKSDQGTKYKAEALKWKVGDNKALTWPESERAGTIDVVIILVLMLFASVIYGWNVALMYGFGTWIVAFCTVAFAYIVMINCLAEIQSAMPFNGGSYGLARVFLGFYPGFLVGSFQLIQLTVYGSTNILYLSHLVTGNYFKCGKQWQIVIWLLYYAFCIAAIGSRHRYIFRFYAVLLFLAIVYLVALICGAASLVSFQDYAPYTESNSTLASSSSPSKVGLNKWFIGGFPGYMYAIIYSTFPFDGLESAMFLTSIAKDPKKSIPVGMVTAVYILFAIALFIIFVVCSMPPGLSSVASLAIPSTPIFQHLFEISEQYATAFTVPFLFISGHMYFLPATLLTHALSESRILPGFLSGERYGFLLCLLANTCFGLGVNFIGYFASSIYTEGYSGDGFVLSLLYNVGLLGGLISCLASIVGFVRFKVQFKDFEREYVSPYGAIGAFLAGGIFCLGILSVGVYAHDLHDAVISFFMIYIGLTVYYFVFARYYQTLSESEMQFLFRVHIDLYAQKAKRKKKRVMRNRSSATVAVEGSPDDSKSLNRRSHEVLIEHNI